MIFFILFYSFMQANANQNLATSLENFKNDKERILMIYGCTEENQDKTCKDIRNAEETTQFVKVSSESIERKNKIISDLVERTSTLECCIGIQPWEQCNSELDKNLLEKAKNCRSKFKVK